MSATVAGAVKALLEAAQLGVPWFRDRAPAGQKVPFGLVTELVSVPERHGDYSDPDADVGVDEQVQVDLYQARRNSDGTRAEDYQLPGHVFRALHGAQLQPINQGRVYGCGVLSWRPLPDPDGNVQHDTYTVRVRRSVV